MSTMVGFPLGLILFLLWSLQTLSVGLEVQNPDLKDSDINKAKVKLLEPPRHGSCCLQFSQDPTPAPTLGKVQTDWDIILNRVPLPSAPRSKNKGNLFWEPGSKLALPLFCESCVFRGQ